MLLARDAIPLGLKRYRKLMVMMKVLPPSSSPSISGFSPHSRGEKEGRGSQVGPPARWSTILLICNYSRRRRNMRD